MARFVMTARRKAALRKAQLASARKRKKGRRGQGKIRRFARGFRKGVDPRESKGVNKRSHTKAHRIGYRTGGAVLGAGIIAGAYGIRRVEKKLLRKSAKGFGRYMGRRGRR